MLTPGDRAVAQGDPAIPGLAIVLDPDEVLALANGTDGPPVIGARATYVRYKPATSCVVGYELATAEGPVLAFAKALAPHGAAKVAKARAKEVCDERWGVGVMSIEGRGVLLAAAASDRDLPALRVMANDAQRERLMRQLLPEHPDLWRHEPRPLRHKPERRWVGVAERDGSPVALIKAYRSADFRRSRAGHRELATSAVRPLGWSGRRAILASSWAQGVALEKLLTTDPSADITEVGAALAALHATERAGELEGIRPSTIAATLEQAADAVGTVLPHLKVSARRLADDVSMELADRDAHRCVVHGDLSADQVVISPTAVHLIDFDEAHVADPAMDLASFGAGLVRAEVERRLGNGRAATLFAQLLEGHQRCGGPPVADRLAAHQAGALLRLGVAPFRERHPEWPTLCEALFLEAERSLAPAAALGGSRWR